MSVVITLFQNVLKDKANLGWTAILKHRCELVVFQYVFLHYHAVGTGWGLLRRALGWCFHPQADT